MSDGIKIVSVGCAEKCTASDTARCLEILREAGQRFLEDNHHQPQPRKETTT